MPDRFSPEHDINAKKTDVGYTMDFSMTSIEEQEELNGFLKATQPIGNDGPVVPPAPGYKYLGGQAGSSEDEYNENTGY